MSIDSDGKQGFGRGFTFPSMSDDGRYIAFAGPATFSDRPGLDINITPPLWSNVFVRDRKAGTLTLASISSAGVQGIGTSGSTRPSISADGRYVAFESDAANLAVGDTNAEGDIFVHDLRTKKTTRVSVGPGGSQGSGESRSPHISGNGRHIVFESDAPNLVQDDTNGTWDAFVHDRKTGKTRRVSVTSDGEEADNGASCGSSISFDGQTVAFTSTSRNLTAGKTNIARDVYVHDLRTDKTERVSVSSDGRESFPWGGSICGHWVSMPRAISGNGRYVSFTSASNNLVPNDTGTYITSYDVFVHDRKTKRTELVSIDSHGGEGDDGSNTGYISRDGRYVAFMSNANNFSSSDTGRNLQDEVFESGGDMDVYIHDRMTGATEMVSLASDGREAVCPGSDGLGGNTAIYPALAADGRHVSFRSCADNLSANDVNAEEDIFVRDRGLGVGVGGFGGSPSHDPPPDDLICLIPEVCIPPNGAISTRDGLLDVSDALTKQGANLYGASLAYRPELGDLLLRIEVEDMPSLHIGAAGFSTAGSPAMIYGLRFKSRDKTYEARATALSAGTFGLFDCPHSPVCTKVADLKGGYGTTGMRVAISLPLADIGLKSGGRLEAVEAFSGLGSFQTGASKILDLVRLR